MLASTMLLSPFTVSRAYTGTVPLAPNTPHSDTLLSGSYPRKSCQPPWIVQLPRPHTAWSFLPSNSPPALHQDAYTLASVFLLAGYFIPEALDIYVKKELLEYFIYN